LGSKGGFYFVCRSLLVLVLVILPPVAGVAALLFLFLPFIVKCIIVFVGAVLCRFWGQRSKNDKDYEKHCGECSGGK